MITAIVYILVVVCNHVLCIYVTICILTIHSNNNNISLIYTYIYSTYVYTCIYYRRNEQ